MAAHGAIGPFRLDGVLRRDVLGEVHRAVDDRESDRVVALRLLPDDLSADAEYRTRFARAAGIGATLVDSHIVPVEQYGDIDGRLYLVTRPPEGAALATVAAQVGPMAPEEVVSIIGQVASALDAMHEADLVHGNLTPSTILLAATEPADVYLLDAGLAWHPGEPTAGLEFTAPERFRGARPDRLTDIYALTCVFYRVLTGSAPYVGGAPELRHAHLAAPVPFLAEYRPELADLLDPVITRGMAKDPTHRYGSAGQFVVAVSEALGSASVGARVPAPPEVTSAAATSAEPAGRIPDVRSWRRRLLAAATAVAVLATVTATTFLIANQVPEPPIEIVAEPSPEPPPPRGPPTDRATLQARLLVPGDVGAGFVAGRYTPPDPQDTLPCGQPAPAGRFPAARFGAVFTRGPAAGVVEGLAVFADATTASAAAVALGEGFACGVVGDAGVPGTIGPAEDVTARVGGDRATRWEQRYDDGTRRTVVVALLGRVAVVLTVQISRGGAPGPEPVAVTEKAVDKILHGF